MAFARIGSISAGSASSNAVTTGALDTTGATLLVLILSDYQGAALSVITDSKGNTWTPLTSYTSAGPRTTIWYCFPAPPSVGTGHTFTATRTGGFMSVAVGAYSGISPGFDQQNGATGSASTLASGSATPSVPNELIIVGAGAGSGAQTVLSVDSGLTIRENHGLGAAGGADYACMLADLIETAIVAKTVTVTFQGAGADAVAIATFRELPIITGVFPVSGVIGTSVTISGNGFGATQGASTVTFNGTTATPSSWSATSIVVPAPIGATTGNVVVTVAGVPSNGVSFTVTPPPPNISSLSPTSGSIGASVTITGTNFGATQGSGGVAFNFVSATVTSWSDTSIVVLVPGGATTGSVVVGANGQSSNGVTFTIIGLNLISLSPTSGMIRASVALTGTNFGAMQGTSFVTFASGVVATPLTWSDTSLVVTVPVGAITGNVQVIVSGVPPSNGISFTIIPTPPPTTGLRPNTLSIVDVVGQVQTCDFEIEDRHGSLNYLVHQSVGITENAVSIFQGSIDEAECRPMESPYDVNDAGLHTLSPVGARIFSIKAQGPNALANRLLTGAFSAQARVNISLVVSTLASGLGIPASIATSPSSLLLNNSFLSDQETLADAFTRLADLATALSGTTHIWKIAWDGTGAVVFLFQPVTNLVASSSIGIGGYPIRANTLRVRTTREQFSNSVVLKLDRYLKNGGEAQVDTFAGTDVFFGVLKCQAPLAGEPTITVNGTAETVGIKDVDTGMDWYWAVGSSIVTAGDTAAGGSDDIVVSYAAHDLRAVVAQDLTSIGSVGLFKVPLTSPDSGNAASPLEYASAELVRRSGLTTHMICQVDCPPGVFQAGYLIPVVLSGMGIVGTSSLSGYFMCRSVRTFDEDLTKFWREVDLIQGPMLYRASQFMRRMVR